MKDEPWRPRPGELVQIWDYMGMEKGPDLKTGWIAGHGKVGYVVKKSSSLTDQANSTCEDIWKIICFGDNEGIYHNVWHGWLRPINKSSDIKKVE